MRRTLLVLFLAACGAPAPAPITLALDDATVAETAAAIAASGISIAVAPDATLLAGCVSVTVHTAGPVPPEEAARLLSSALETSGLTMRATPDGWVVDLASGARVPSSCTSYLVTRFLDGMAGPDDGPTLPAAEPPPVDPTPVAEPAAIDEANVVAGIRQISETEVVLTPAARDAIFDPRSQAAQTARVVPHEEGGRVVGMRLFGIRAGGVLDALGLRNGDTVLTVAGRDVSSPDGALDAYAAIARSTEPVPVGLLRAGRELTIRYRVEAE